MRSSTFASRTGVQKAPAPTTTKSGKKFGFSFGGRKKKYSPSGSVEVVNRIVERDYIASSADRMTKNAVSVHKGTLVAVVQNPPLDAPPGYTYIIPSSAKRIGSAMKLVLTEAFGDDSQNEQVCESFY